MRFGLPESSGERRFDFLVGIVLPSALLGLNATPFDDSSGAPRCPCFGPIAGVTASVGWVLYVLRVLARSPKVGSAVAGGFAGVAGLTGAGAVVLLSGLRLSAVLEAVTALLLLASALSLARLSYRTSSSFPRSRGIFLVSLIAVLSLSSFPGYWAFVNDHERAIRDRIHLLPEGKQLPLRSVVPGDWTTVEVFGPYTTREEIDRTLGFDWDSPRKRALERSEGRLLIVFASKKDVVQSVFLPLSSNPRLCISDEMIQRVRGTCPD
jgi:hypothetical protein